MPAHDSQQQMGPVREEEKRSSPALHRAWQISIVTTLCAGLFHMVNLVGAGRGGFGPALITPFRAAFLVSWALLVAGFIAERRRPRLEQADALVAIVAAVFLARGLFNPETLETVINWIITGAGVFYLVRHGVRDRGDVRLVIITLAAAAAVISAAGFGEYLVKKNPLFDAIVVDVVGIDTRVGASSQFYRVRSLVGHPGFVGAVLVSAAPLVMLAFWRRRLLLAVSLVLLATTLFLTFSRGSWLLGIMFLLPFLLYHSRFWLRRNYRWAAPALVLITTFIVVDYLARDEVSARLGRKPEEAGLVWTKGRDGPYLVTSGEADGAAPYNKFVYFDVDDGFFRSEHGSATIVIHYFDRGLGAIHVDYDSWNESAGEEDGAYAPSGYINKTDSHEWTTAAFFLESPRFDGRQNSGADFRIVDDDSLFIIDEVTVQKGKLKLPSIIAQQFLSRGGSLNTRAGQYPFAWSVLKENPLGVGLYNTPGTNHHAIDSLPLTWMMEFGWLGLPLLGLLAICALREGVRAWKAKSGPAVVLLLTLALLLLHGMHLMILYDKPSLILFGAAGALFTLVRPWRRGGAAVPVSNNDCML